jgi:hypothetical protein
MYKPDPMLFPALLLPLVQIAASPGSYTQSITEPDGTFLMQTRAQRLTAPGKPDIWLVGAVHIGTRQYYSQLQTLLDRQNLVYFEGVKNESTLGIPDMKPDPKAARPIYKVFSDAVGLDFQLSDINYNHPDWKDVDLTWGQIMALNRKASKGKPDQLDKISTLFDPNGKTVKLFATMMGSASPGTREAFKIMMVKMVASGLGPGLDPTTNEIVVGERNRAVLNDLKKTLSKPDPPKSIAIFYGALHLTGMEKSLAASYGYREANKEWFTSASADPKKLDSTGKQLLESFQKQFESKKN